MSELDDRIAASLDPRFLAGVDLLGRRRGTMFAETVEARWPAAVTVALCLYQWDPELKTFRRSCEGDGR